MNSINKIFFSALVIISILPILNYAQNLGIPWEYDFNQYIIKNIGLGNERIKDSAIKSLTTSVINNSENTKTNAYTFKYMFDKNGRVVQFDSNIDPNGQGLPQGAFEYTLNNDGKVYEKFWNEERNGNLIMKRRELYSYTNGIISEIEYFITYADKTNKVLRAETLIYNTTYTKNGQNFIVETKTNKESSIEPQGTSIKQYKIKNDKNGNPIIIQILNDFGKYDTKYEISYNKNGLVTKINEYSGTVIKTSTNDFKYDNRNNLVEFSTYFREKFVHKCKLEYILHKGKSIPVNCNYYNNSNSLMTKIIYEYEFFD